MNLLGAHIVHRKRLAEMLVHRVDGVSIGISGNMTMFLRIPVYLVIYDSGQVSLEHPLPSWHSSHKCEYMNETRHEHVGVTLGADRASAEASRGDARAGGWLRHFQGPLSSHTMYLLISFKKSIAPHNRQLCISTSYSKQ